MPSVVTTRNSTWATAKTWSASEGLTAALMNLQVRDKVNALKSPSYFRCYIDQASDYTTTSTAFADVDGTNLKATITTGGGALLLGFSGSIFQSVATVSRLYFDIDIDGTRLGLDDGLINFRPVTLPDSYGVSFTHVTAALSSASHIIKLQWKVSGGTGGLYAGAGTSNQDTHPTFWGVELI